MSLAPSIIKTRCFGKEQSTTERIKAQENTTGAQNNDTGLILNYQCGRAERVFNPLPHSDNSIKRTREGTKLDRKDKISCNINSAHIDRRSEGFLH